MLNCSCEHSFEREKQCRHFTQSVWVNEIIYFLKLNYTEFTWLRTLRKAFVRDALQRVSAMAFARIYFCVSYCAADSRDAEGKGLIFFPHGCVQFLLVAFLPSRRSLASSNLSSVHAASCQVALGLLFGGGFICFGGFMDLLFGLFRK